MLCLVWFVSAIYSLNTQHHSNNLFLLVYNVSAAPQHKNGTFKLKLLSPGQEYQVWIRAVTGAGPGPNAVIRFKTKQLENYGIASHLNYFLFECVIMLV